MNYLALTTGSEFADWIMVACGNAFGAILAYRAVVYFFREDWGKLVTYAFAAVFVFGFVFFPDQAQKVLGEVWGKVSETSAAPALEKVQQR
ncbi:hypothetical protein ACIG0A_33665 [Streptomyces californicus]|uniref:hypothetical protein n=1 Tax=Streptomyces californicus TaxID=67351 RepID=UPI0037D83A1B